MCPESSGRTRSPQNVPEALRMCPEPSECACSPPKRGTKKKINARNPQDVPQNSQSPQDVPGALRSPLIPSSSAPSRCSPTDYLPVSFPLPALALAKLSGKQTLFLPLKACGHQLSCLDGQQADSILASRKGLEAHLSF